MAKTAKKTVKKSAQKNPKDAQTAPSRASNGGELAAALGSLDTEQLSESTRVYALAKTLGVTSRELIDALGELGIKKVAQSSLSRDDVLALVRSASEAAPRSRRNARKATRKADKPDVDEEKIRERVRKNVANEIHQIEEKVEAELADIPEGTAPTVGETDGDIDDIVPEITPAPDNDADQATAAFAPLFVAPTADDDDDLEVESLDDKPQSRRSRRRSSRRGSRAEETPAAVEPHQTKETDEVEQVDEPVATRGSTRLEAQRRRRSEMREAGRKRKHIVSQAEFLARRESVDRTMVVRERARHDGPGQVTQVGVLEDELLVEHFVTSEAQASMIGNIYLGRVQNVLASMEAAFIDIGIGRNGVLYSSEIDWRTTGSGSGRARKIEQVLKSGDQVLVQVSKDPLGHKGPRLTTQISLAGRYLVYVPNGRSAGISRKLPAPERKRLKDILSRVIPGKGGAIIRTAAENVPEESIAADVKRLHDMWEDISERTEQEKNSKGAKPVTLYEEPDMLVKVVRDLFNEDFTKLVIDGKRAWNTVSAYVNSVAPDLADRLERFQGDGEDAFEHFRIEEQIQKALARKVWLPSGGHLIIESTEAMVVIDVNTGKFTGSGGNLEETVTRNNLEAAEEIVRQMRLRDLGGMIVVDFIDMVLPENQDLVLRRLKEALGRDRTRHQVSEVTSLGLVQITRKRLGTGLLETFATECEHCRGRGLILHDDPVDAHDNEETRRPKRGKESNDEAIDTRGPNRERARSTQEDLEKIAASVVAVDETDDEQPAREEKSDDEQSRRSSRRRGRRGGGRGRGRHHAPETSNEKADEQLSEVEQIAAQAVARAGELDPEEPSGADYVSNEKTFQEAVKEFEASPRRRRKTRGNSRSDRRPRREDFAEAAEDADEAPQPAPAEKEQTPETVVVRSRGRRRAVRRTMHSTDTAPEQSRRSPQEAPVKAPDSGEANVEKRKDNRGRGRRRAVRRSGRRG